MNMRISSAVLALAAAAALTAGTVAPAAAASDPKPAAQTKSETATPTAKEDKRRYCIEETIVGSRIPKRACRTRSAWIALTGVDPAEAR